MESLSSPGALGSLRRTIRSSISLGRYPVRSWSVSGTRLSSLFFFTRPNQSSTIWLAIDLNVVVDVHAHRLPLGHDIALGRKRLQRGSIKGGIERGTTPFPLAERTLIHALQEFRDGLVEIGEREELIVAQYGDEPAF